MQNTPQMPRGNLLSMFMQFRQNPLAMLSKRFNIPDGVMPYMWNAQTQNDVNRGFDNAGLAGQLSGIQAAITGGFANADVSRANADLERQLSMAQLSASQQAQNAFIAQGFANEVNDLYNRLANCPVPSTPVYGRTPIFTPTSTPTTTPAA